MLEGIDTKGNFNRPRLCFLRNESKHLDLDALPRLRVDKLGIDKRTVRDGAPSLLRRPAVKLLEEQRLVRLLPTEIVPLVVRAAHHLAQLVPAVREDEPVRDPLVLSVYGLPVTHRERVLGDRLQRPPHIDREHASTSQPLDFSRVLDRDVEIVQRPCGREVRVDAVGGRAIVGTFGRVGGQTADTMGEDNGFGGAGPARML